MILICVLWSPRVVCGEAFSARVGAYGVWMEPKGDDAEQVSDGSPGFGLEIIASPAMFGNFFAAAAGFEYIEMKRQDTEIEDDYTGLTWEQQTRQIYRRLFIGGMVGHQGHGFFRPHAGANLALVYYSIYTDAVLEDPYDEDEIKENLSKKGRFGFGYDFTLGMELNFRDKVYVDFGAKYLQSLSIPQQLGEDSEYIHPQYVQFYVGLLIGI